MMGSLSAILSFFEEALPSKGKTRARVGMDRNNTKNIVAKWHRKSFLPIQSLTSLLHILTPLPNKGNFFFPERIYVPFSSEFNAGNPLITKGLPTMGRCHYPLDNIQAPSRLCLFLPGQWNPWLHVACSSPKVTSGKETNVIMCLHWMCFMCNFTAPQALCGLKVVHIFH